MANATTLNARTGGMYGFSMGEWEVAVKRRPGDVAGVDFRTGAAWGVAGLVTGLVMLVAVLSGAAV